MSIKEFSAFPSRRKIGYFGVAPPPEIATHWLDLGLELVPAEEFSISELDSLCSCDSYIFSQDIDDPKQIAASLAIYGKALLDCDRRVYVRIAKAKEFDPLLRARILSAISSEKLPASGLSPDEIASVGAWFTISDKANFSPVVHVCDASDDWPQIAKLIAANRAGEAPKLDLEIFAQDATDEQLLLDPDHALLLRRAFWNCKKVYLRQMPDGKSEAKAYRAYAERDDPEMPFLPWPYLHFVKIGERKKISMEYLSYRHSSMGYIPFHLGIRLSLKRCVLGAQDGILVGDFVAEAECIRDCARGGRAVPVIANLFSKTLRAWHEVSIKDSAQSVATLLPKLLPPDTEIPEARKAILTSLGATLTVDSMREKLQKCTMTPIRIGPCHGDLNSTNVLVRGTDAIVIDFEKVKLNLPPLFDVASLEAGLLVEGFANGENPIEPTTLIDSVKPLYERDALIDQIASCHPTEPTAWFHACVHQIRLQARQLECHAGQYAAILSIVLLKKICNTAVLDTETVKVGHRAAAFLLAEKILLECPEIYASAAPVEKNEPAS